MPDLAMELRHLAQADRHICDGERRALMMQESIARAEALNMNADHARQLLALIVDGLDIYETHRQMILEAIEYIDRRSARSVDLWQRT